MWCCVLALSVAHVTTSSADETFWVRHSPGPILSESPDTSRCDSGYIAEPRVVYDSDSRKYFMFYSGCVDRDRPNREALCLATAPSPSGPWTRFDSPHGRHALLAPGAAGDYDYDRNWGQGTVLKTGPHSWKMWTVGDSDPSAAHIPRVGYATSTDGYHWMKHRGTKYGGAIFEDFSAGAGIIEIAVIQEGDSFHAWYFSYTGDTIKYATSPNGIDWTIHRKVLKGSQIGGVGNVVKVEGAYYMTMTRPDLKGADIYTSTNKTDWTMLNTATLRPSSQGWDSARVYYPFLLPASATDWYLFYTGASVPDDTQATIGFARADLSRRP